VTYPMQKSGPSAAGILIGIALMVIGAVGGIVLTVASVQSVEHTVNSYKRVDASTGGAVTFSETGRYYAYYERHGIKNRGQIPPLRVKLSGPAGRQLLLTDIGRTGTNEHYDFGDHEGVRITGFDVPRTGQYRVTILGESAGTSGTEIAFGKGSITKGLLGLVGGLLGGGLIGFIGLIVLITTVVRRGRHRRRLAQAAYGGGYGPPGAYGPPGFGQPGTWPPSAPGPSQWPAPPGQPGSPPPPGRPGGWAPPPPPPPGSGATNDPGQPGWGGPGR